MTIAPDPGDETELHAFADGLLDPARAAAVEARLAADPAAAGRVAAWRRQNERILTLASAPAGEPLPPALRPARLRRRRRRELRRLAAAALVALLAGGGAGWLGGRGLPPPDAGAPAGLLGDAARAHRDLAEAPELGRPLDVGDPDSVGERLSRWLDHRLAVPDLSPFGLRLTGARATRTAAGAPAAVVAYEDGAAARFTLYLARAEQAPEPTVRAAEGGGRAASWSYEELRCVLIAETATPERLREIARGVNAELERAG